MKSDGALGITLVIDIGKSHAKLLWVDDVGIVRERRTRENHSVPSTLGYPALDIDGLTVWIRQCLPESSLTTRCRSIIACTHGAAFVGLDDHGRAWEPMDYEFDGFAQLPVEIVRAYEQQLDDFSSTLSPDLPAGLNAARQLYWLQYAHPQTWAKTRCLLPYPQYWALWLSGIVSSEVSSLGCHTQLWSVENQQYSALAQTQGWANLFAPLKPAWQVLGHVRPALAAGLSLPIDCEVHVGVHDSNACLARYLNVEPDEIANTFDAPASSLTLVSSGTWTVVMAPGADATALLPDLDMLGNVSVSGQATPTARFMGGREFAAILDGAPADQASEQDLLSVLQSETFALPAFASQGGPFRGQTGCVVRRGEVIALQTIAPQERAALAALYCAQVTCWLISRLRPEADVAERDGRHRVVVEGPLAANPLYMAVLQALLKNFACFSSVDEMEGTARGAWQLTRWGSPSGKQPTAGGAAGEEDTAFLAAAPACNLPGLLDYHQRWCRLVGSSTPLNVRAALPPH